LKRWTINLIIINYHNDASQLIHFIHKVTSGYISGTMTTENRNQSRRRFIGLGFVLAAAFPVLKFIIASTKKEQTVKMLTQDGRLVEIDKNMMPGNKRQITDSELKVWVKNSLKK
jgi:hypothetical protein